MENIRESIYEKIGRLARKNFKAMLDYYEYDHGYESQYESGDEFDTDNNLEGDKG